MYLIRSHESHYLYSTWFTIKTDSLIALSILWLTWLKNSNRFLISTDLLLNVFIHSWIKSIPDSTFSTLIFKLAAIIWYHVIFVMLYILAALHFNLSNLWWNYCIQYCLNLWIFKSSVFYLFKFYYIFLLNCHYLKYLK